MLGRIKLLLIAGLICHVLSAKSNTNDVVVDNLEELRALFYEHQDEWIPLALPGNAVLFQDFGLVVPFNAEGDFPKKFIQQFPGEYSEFGIVTYRITLVEDYYTRQVVICDTANMAELCRMDIDPLHDPYAYLRWSYGLSALDSFTGIHETDIQRMDSAKIAADFLLVEQQYYADYVIAEDQARQAQAAVQMMAMSAGPPPLPDGDSGGSIPSNVVFTTSGTNLVSMTADSNSVVTMAINVPTNFGGEHIEIFSKDDLIFSQGWNISQAWLPTFGNPSVSWTDPDTDNKNVRYYIISDADADSDGDGYSDLREEIFEKNGNGSDVFDYVDDDGDGMHDWYEIKLFGDLSQDGSDDFDGDLLPNNVEMVYDSNTASVVWNSDPTIKDTDADGMDDYLETTVYTFLDPLNPADRDYDHDGASNFDEHNGTTDLDDWDTDDDGLPDGWEIEWSLNPNQHTDPSSDPEPDGLTHLQEYMNGSSPTSSDTDGDGTDDKTEVEQGSSPSNNADNGHPPAASDTEEVTFDLDGYLGTTGYIMEISGERTVRVLSDVIDATGEWQTHRFRKGETYTVSISCGHDSSHKKCLARILDGGGVVLDDPKDIFHLSTVVDPANKAKLHFPKITVTASQNEMTLKHDNQCQLSMTTAPAGLEFSDHEFEIKFQHEFDYAWRTLGTGTTMDWRTAVAGEFDLRAKATAGGEETIVSEAIQAEVQFPTRTQMKSDSALLAKMDAKWQENLILSTPSEYWEVGFAIVLDTRTDQYADLNHDKAGPATPGDKVEIHWFNLPSDGTPLSNSQGTTYFVGLFHTHPPYEFAPTNSLGRATGHSTGFEGDIMEANEAGIPGFVYDYVVAGDWIYPGHAETNTAHVYDYGPERKEKIYE